jgi:hypothetical protein
MADVLRVLGWRQAAVRLLLAAQGGTLIGAVISSTWMAVPVALVYIVAVTLLATYDAFERFVLGVDDGEGDGDD